ncbi:MAG: hypothetical protein GY856_18310 [bacterium]|nr:hypothetical protein [bacterium]
MPLMRNLLPPLLIFVLALSIRLIFLSGIEAYPKFEHIKNRLDDQVAFDQWAKSIVAGREFDYSATDHEFAHWAGRYRGIYPQAPLYPSFLAVVYKVFGFRYDLVRAVQMLLGAVGGVLIYFLARHFLRPKTAIGCGVAAALYGPFVFYEATLLRAATFGFAAALGLFLLAGIARSTTPDTVRDRLICLGAGVVLAAGVLLRENLLPWSVAAVGWLVLERSRRAAGLMVLGLLVPLLPVIALNTARSGRPAFISSSGPYNFFLGNVHDASGLAAGPTPYYLTVKASGPPESVDLLSETFQDIRRHPGAFMKLQLRKIRYFFGPEEVPNNLSYAMAKKTNPRLAWAFLEFHHVFPIALVGVVLSLRRFQRFALLHLYTLCYAAATIVFFVPSRLRQPVVLALLLFAGLAVEWWCTALAERRWRSAVAVFLGVLVAVLWLRPGPSTFRHTDYAMAAAAHFSLAEELERDLRIDEARRHYARAVSLFPDHDRALMRFAAIETRRPAGDPADDPRAPALCDEARQAMAAGNHREALRLLAEAVERAPGSALPHHYLSNVYFLLNDPRRSMEHLERAVELAPGNRLFRENLKALRRSREIPE